MAMKPSDWPVLARYDQDHLSRVALPLGGIGTGTVSLGGRGNLFPWEIVNRPATGYRPPSSFFILYAKPAGGSSVTRILEGIIEEQYYEGGAGCRVEAHGFPRFRHCEFQTAYPLGQVLLSDPDVPVDVRLEAFNPLIPGDADASGMPLAVFRYVLHNRTNRSVTASVCGNLNNFIGTDGIIGKTDKNINEFRDDKGIRGIFMRSEGVDPGPRRSVPWR